jgi:hypothetical protein
VAPRGLSVSQKSFVTAMHTLFGMAGFRYHLRLRRIPADGVIENINDPIRAKEATGLGDP